MLLETLQSSPVNAKQIAEWTAKDPVLSKVKKWLSQGWADTDDHAEELRPYRQRKEELSLQDGCILWGSRVVVPEQGRKLVIEELHAEHQGMSRMKSLGRSFVWWPNMDADVQERVKRCEVCQAHQKVPAAAPLHPWEWPELPWCRLHADYAGPFMGKMFLLIMDAHSKWLEAHIVESATSAATIQKMKASFASHGLPVTLVTDNGSVFTSQEFEEFLTKNGISHIKTSPYHPASNGLIERAVQTMKLALKKGAGKDLESCLMRLLFRYRMTPHASTGASPAELLMGRRLRSHLSMIHPGVKEIGEATQELVQEKVRATQNRQKKWHDKRAKPRSFIIGDQVLVLNFGRGPNWLPGKVTSIRGPVSVTVELADGRSVKRHYDHIRASSLSEAETVVQRDVVPRQQATWSESLSLGSEQEFPPAVPAQEPVLAPE